MDTKKPPYGESPAYLIAAAYSGHQSGDHELERVARRRLVRQYGIRLTFGQPTGQVAPPETVEAC